ncbi:SDR family NAD(P)-dependent oxidoreductase [Mycolicibacter arupensis]|uniref:SDR family NAD(P)-dependent oxidoreductase n=1 Tax=Mycolicibacter arupensis TaxID=342002 RepID=UPI0011DB597A|nr:SDR family NAD(P)-dependent oxidoreductase [Mycolicibacter arupensis]KAA1431986.1 SDR family NAD(P)-dependent oxidoreductase [Mycolicibacter arupensis]TXH25637.1 MAG: SDR family NAD(P)-dependent oxidoreductase [Mycobacterium sp.]
MSSGDQSGWALQYGPWAVVAGGSEGVGAEFAHVLATAGINLVLIARKPAPLRHTADRCRALGVGVRELTVDLARPDAAAQVAEATSELDVGLLIYNAGANTHSAEFLDGDLAAFERVLDLNVRTPLGMVHHFGTAMRLRQRGGLLLVGSLAGYLGSARQSVYGGAKAFSRIYAEGLWLELRDANVHVLELVLGVTRTPAMRRAGLNFDIPGMRVSDPADVAREGLEALPHGPVHVIAAHADNPALRATSDRSAAVLASHRMMRRLLTSAPHESDAPPAD